MKSKKSIPDTLTFKLTVALLCCILPIIAVAVYNHIQSFHLVTQQIRDTHTYALGTYVNQLDQEFFSASQYLSSLTFSNAGVSSLKSSIRTNDYYYASHSLSMEMSDHFMLYQYVDGLLLYAPESSCYLRTLSDRISLSAGDRAAFDQAVQSEILCGESTLYQWETLNFSDETYLFWVNYSNQIYTSYFVNIQKLEQALGSLGNLHLHICTDEADLISTSEDSPGLIPIYYYSTNSPVILEEIFSEEEAFQSMPFLQRYYILVIITIPLSLPVIWLIVRRLVYRPLNYINRSISRIQDGDITYRMSSDHSCAEFRSIHQSFNYMMDELEKLKISVYEEKLKGQKAEMNNILFQLRPHFLINTLNMLYNLIMIRSYDNAKQLIRFSTNYLRYMVNTTQNFVPLKDELNHIQNYLGIQQQRYEGRFTFTLEVDPYIQDTVIPPFLLQNTDRIRMM